MMRFWGKLVDCIRFRNPLCFPVVFIRSIGWRTFGRKGDPVSPRRLSENRLFSKSLVCKLLIYKGLSFQKL